MPITVTVNDVSGVTPVYIYICDCVNTLDCVYMGDSSTFPYSFDIPTPFDEQSCYIVKIIDSNGCIKTETLTV